MATPRRRSPRARTVRQALAQPPRADGGPTLITPAAAVSIGMAGVAEKLAASPVPIPVSFRGEWFPASVKLPDRDQPLRLAKVFATREGLYVYIRPPAQSDRLTGAHPEWFSPIHYDKTPRPAGGYAARQKGFHVVTDAGTVVVQPLGGCGCSAGALKAWRPTWATRNEAWESTR